MNDQPSLFDPRPGRHRNTDFHTSVAAGMGVAYRAGSQKYFLVNAFSHAYPNNLTDEEAAEAACISLTSADHVVTAHHLACCRARSLADSHSPLHGLARCTPSLRRRPLWLEELYHAAKRTAAPTGAGALARPSR